MNEIHCDAVIAGCGVAGLFCALHLPADWKVILLSKAEAEESDSFLAQGGICVMRGEEDYSGYYEDTMRAGHYENSPESVNIMLRSSPEVIEALVGFGVDFARTAEGDFDYTREGAHSRPRILYHKDITGQEITSRLLAEARKRPNLTFMTQTTMVDLIAENNVCRGLRVRHNRSGQESLIFAPYQVLATGGIGGCYSHSTNYPHLTGDALELAKKYGIDTMHLDYVQIHPTTLFSQRKGKRFLISESVRGEGALLYDRYGERFVDELLPRDVVTQAIHRKMEEQNTLYVWLDMRPLGKDVILSHFPNIYEECLREGWDALKTPVPVVPAQHYFMGGITVDSCGRTSMTNLFAVGETACNNVHGANRLASNSLLESLVWAKRAAFVMNGRTPDETTKG